MNCFQLFLKDTKKFLSNTSSISLFISKSGRPPSKKFKDRKASIRIGMLSSASEFTGKAYLMKILCFVGLQMFIIFLSIFFNG